MATTAALPFDLANVPDGYWDRATNPQRLRDLKTAGSRDVVPIPPNMIRVDPNHNPRDYRLPENRAHLDELKLSIREEGVKIPLLCRWDFLDPGDKTKSCIVIDGECRLRCCLELIQEGVEIATVPVLQDDSKSESDRLLNAILANTGKPLSKWELGGAFRRFQKLGWSLELLVKKTGYTERFVKEAVELSDAPDDVKYLLSEQAVTPSLALSQIRKSGSGASLILKQKVEQAKAAGKSKAARDTKAPRNQLKDAAVALFKTFSEQEIADLDNTEVEFFSVDRKRLRTLYRALNQGK